MQDIVQTTKDHGNMDRLAWDLYNIPHHCSYLALSDEKGDTETTPKPLIKELLEQGGEGAYLVSTSAPIHDTKEGREQQQPPLIQAKKCYERYLREIDGARFLVTMEEPNATSPDSIEFKIDGAGLSLDKKLISAAAVITSSRAPRAG